MKFIAKIELLLIALWLGAAVFFSFGVAPSAFGVLPTRELAGGVVNRTLTIINFTGIGISVLLLLSSLIPRGEAKKIWVWVQRFLILVVGAACGLGQLILGVYLEHLRNLMGRPIDEIAVENPLRIRFNEWHQYSVWTLITGMIAALLVFLIISRSYSESAEGSKTNEIPNVDLPDELKM